MDTTLQIILLAASSAFFLFILRMVILRKLALSYSLTWIFMSLMLILASAWPGGLFWLSETLHIKEPVNTIFLCVLFLLLLISFVQTAAITKGAEAAKVLTQEYALLKKRYDDLLSGMDDRLNAAEDSISRMGAAAPEKGNDGSAP